MYETIEEILERIAIPGEVTEIAGNDFINARRLTLETGRQVVLLFINLTTPGYGEWSKKNKRHIQMTYGAAKLMEPYRYAQERHLPLFPLLYVNSEAIQQYLTYDERAFIEHFAPLPSYEGPDRPTYLGSGVDTSQHILYVASCQLTNERGNATRPDVRSAFVQNTLSNARILVDDHKSGKTGHAQLFNFRQGNQLTYARAALMTLLNESDGFIPLDNVAQHSSNPLPQVPDTEASDLTSHLLTTLYRFKNLILEGVPGTGKTYHVDQLSTHWQWTEPSLQTLGSFEATTFHPTTSYEDFIEGLKPKTSAEASQSSSSDSHSFDPTTKAEKWFIEAPESTEGGWRIQDGSFLNLCRRATLNPEQDHLLLIDEFNRANVAKVLGELLTTIERSKRATWHQGIPEPELEHATLSLSTPTGEQGYWDYRRCQVISLSHSKRRLFIPSNLYVVATQNTSDRSVEPLDLAARRRFAFERIDPMNLDLLTHVLSKCEVELNLFTMTSLKVWGQLNTYLKREIGPDAQLGHSYWMVLVTEYSSTWSEQVITSVWKQEILPQLIEILMTASSDPQADYLQEGMHLPRLIGQLGFKLVSHGEGLNQMLMVESLSSPEPTGSFLT